MRLFEGPDLRSAAVVSGASSVRPAVSDQLQPHQQLGTLQAMLQATEHALQCSPAFLIMFYLSITTHWLAPDGLRGRRAMFMGAGGDQ